eukprot:gene18131-21084_t
MLHALETDRLLLNDLSLSDLEDFFLYRSDPIVTRYQGFRPETPEEAKQFIEKLKPFPFPFETLVNPGWYQLGIRLKIENGLSVLIGDLGVHLFDDDPSSIELGITLTSKFQSQGIATEVMKAIIDTCFQHPTIERIVCSTDPRNDACRKLLSKLGFELFKFEKDAFVLREETVDDMIFHLHKP